MPRRYALQALQGKWSKRAKESHDISGGSREKKGKR